MAKIIQRSDKNYVPEGAVIIGRQTALEHQWDLINNWKPRRDVWYFRFGCGLLSGASIVSATLIMGHYRRKLKLYTFGRPTLFIPGVIFPALFLPVLHQKMVSEPILLHEQCPVCIQMRSVTLQAIAGIIYPTVIHSIGAFMVANSFATYRLPEFSFMKPGETLRIWRMLSKPLFSNLPMHFLLQFAMAIFVTEMQAKELFKIQAKLTLSQEQSLPQRQ